MSTPLVDASDLTDQELAAVIGLCGPNAVQRATGLPLTRLVSAAPQRFEARDPLADLRCPRGCGAFVSSSRVRACRACRREDAAGRRERAATVLDAGLVGIAAENQLMAAEGVSRRIAQKLIMQVRTERREALPASYRVARGRRLPS